MLRRRHLVFALVILAPACATGTSQATGARGTVTVGVTTTGAASAKALTFRVSIEPAGVDGTVRANAGVFTRSSIPPGDHVVRLLDVPASCTVAGSGERRISVAARGSAIVRFAVQCR
jgi:hypothetical protein